MSAKSDSTVGVQRFEETAWSVVLAAGEESGEPGCEISPAIAQSKLLTIEGVDEAEIQLIGVPPWNQNVIGDVGRMKLGMV